jgi:hypothetical protein
VKLIDSCNTWAVDKQYKNKHTFVLDLPYNIVLGKVSGMERMYLLAEKQGHPYPPKIKRT